MKLRVVVFGTGSPLSLAVFAAAGRAADVVAVVTPGGPPLHDARSAARRFVRWRAAGPLRRLARQAGARVVDAHRRSLAEDLGRLAPDLLCVASFPRLLPPALLATARYGAVGLHPSLLPRHRGPDPLFWTYFHDDREAGITLYWLDGNEDTGDILYQQAVTLSRGRPVTELYADLARRGACLLERALGEIPSGTAPRRPQDATRTTREPSPEPGACRIDWARWSAERVFHVLSGVGRWYPLLLEASGRPVHIGGGRRLLLEPHDRPPGTIERCSDGFRLFCQQGSVDVSAAMPVQRLPRPFRRVPGCGSGRSG